MKFSKMEEEARQIVICAGRDVELEEIWLGLGKRESHFWRSKACDLMRRVCLKSSLLPPKIERKTRLGRGSKAVYGIA